MASPCSELKEEILELRQDVLEYKPGKASTCPDRVEFPKVLYIGLFGTTGCGKTSLINSLRFAVSGKLRKTKWLQTATQEKAGGHTMFRRLANITESIYVVDNRGLDDPNTQRAISELAAQLDGERGYSERVNWQEDDGMEQVHAQKLDDEDENAKHPIGCAVFVFSARHDIETNTNGLNDVIDFLHGHQGRYPVAIITHVDVAEKTHLETLKTVLRVCGISEIFEVANLTGDKPKLEEPYQLSLLSLIERCMTDGDDTLIFKYYQRKEQDRKDRQLKKAINAAEEENKRKQEEMARERERIELERRAEEYRLEAERSRLHFENQARLQEKQFRREAELQREQMSALKEEMRDRAAREQERDQRFQEEMRKMRADKQDELRRMMEANRQKESSCLVM